MSFDNTWPKWRDSIIEVFQDRTWQLDSVQSGFVTMIAVHLIVTNKYKKSTEEHNKSTSHVNVHQRVQSSYLVLSILRYGYNQLRSHFEKQHNTHSTHGNISTRDHDTVVCLFNQSLIDTAWSLHLSIAFGHLKYDNFLIFKQNALRIYICLPICSSVKKWFIF